MSIFSGDFSLLKLTLLWLTLSIPAQACEYR